MNDMKYCDSCNEPILDLYYHTVASKFYLHLKCIQCYSCHKILKKKCFILNGKFLCAKDHAKLQQQQQHHDDHHYTTQQQLNTRLCKFCKQKVNACDYVIRLDEHQISHTLCFNCTKCSKQINAGQKYGLLNDQLYCEQHYIEQVSTASLNTIAFDSTTSAESSPFSLNESPYDSNMCTSTTTSTSTSSGTHERTPLVNYNNQNYEETTYDLLTDKKRKLSFDETTTTSDHLITSSSSSASPTSTVDTTYSCFNREQHRLITCTKKKRNRTSFKHQQLRIMKNFFIINRNPDSKDLKELSELTSLSKRTLQVWFQNSRAKQRKTTPTPLPPSSNTFNHVHAACLLLNGKMEQNENGFAYENDDFDDNDDDTIIDNKHL